MEEEKVETIEEEVVEEKVEEIKPEVAQAKISDILCSDCGGVIPAEDADAGKHICPKCYGYDKQ